MGNSAVFRDGLPLIGFIRVPVYIIEFSTIPLSRFGNQCKFTLF
ncbi:hypothetical protein TSAR_013609 [Trichomalopsis sarcophagae]|uniref:Uncharacterized protein n=1 Tax=Trichomalopsis sarcophagae TaxID=543379 RepID=A0A232EWV1_9HYME|nr:hypothetical protein TSAR_013609 [Trichomalopsis sarcophagae]